MRPTLATVLSARDWEPRLAGVARHSGLVRLVGRVFEPIELEHLPRPDWVVVGAETAWLEPGWVEAMHAAGSGVVGVFGDDAETHHLERMGMDALASAAGDPISLLRSLLVPPDVGPRRRAPAVGVLGPPGSGTTTVAIALAGDDPGATIVDTDPIPGIGPTLGMAPPDRVDVGSRTVPARRHSDAGVLVVTAGGEPDIAGIVAVCRREADLVVVDVHRDFNDRLAWCASDLVLVVDASVQGMLRAIAMIDRWAWPTPRLVLNRVTDLPGAVEAARSSLGLEPMACVPLSVDPLTAAREGLAAQSSGRLAAG